jgi:hypothetical protein
MRYETKDGKEILAIEAKVQKDGVYPLMVQGGEGNNPGLPVEMVIDPGASFYYTLDDGELQYSDGGKELKLLPIHGKMGIKKVRLVAMGINGGEVFKARVQPLSMEGAWVIIASGTKTGGGIDCSNETAKIENPDNTAQMMAVFMAVVGGTGDMKADPNGRNMDWSEIASRVPSKLSEANTTFRATTLLSGDAIQYQSYLEFPKSDSSSSLPPAIPISLAICLPVCWLGRKRINARMLRVLVNVSVIFMLMIVSTGCFDLELYGSTSLDAKFTKIEYMGGEEKGVLALTEEYKGTPKGKPIWKLTGSGAYDVSLKIDTTVSNDKGEEVTTTDTCTGVITFPVTAYVYKDFQVNLPSAE